MPIAPDPPFPKRAGHVVRSKDWNDLVVEVRRLDSAKVTRAGAATITGPLTVQDSQMRTSPVVGTRLHVMDSAAPAVVRIQSELPSGPVRVEMWADRRGSTNEWRPAYIQSVDRGDFTGGLSFATNGTGMAQRRQSVEGMRLVNGRLAVGTVTAWPAAPLHVMDDESPAVVRIQSGVASGAGRLEIWSGQPDSAGEWRPGYIQAYDAGAPGNFTGGLSFATNGVGAGAKQGAVEAMRIVNGRVGVGAMTASPASRLHVVDDASPAVLRVQSTAAPGAARLEMWTHPRESANEWRLGYIQGFDAGAPGGFTGGLSLGTNGAGLGQRQGEVEAMRLVNGRVAIGAGVSPAARLHVVDTVSPAVVRIQSTVASGASRLEMWSDAPGGAAEWRPGFIQSIDAGGFTGGLAFGTNGSGDAQRQGEVEVMRLVNGRLGIGLTAPGRMLDVADRIRVRQGPSGSAALSLFQANADRAFLGMFNDNIVSLSSNPGSTLGLLVDMTTGNAGVRVGPHPQLSLWVNGDTYVTTRLRDNRIRSALAASNQISIFSFFNQTGWNDIPGMNATIVSPTWIFGAQWFLFRFNMPGVQVQGVTQAQAEFRLMVDNVQQAYALHEFHTDSWALQGVSLERMLNLAQGSHTVSVQWSIRSPQARIGIPGGLPEVRATLWGSFNGDVRGLNIIEL